MIYDELSKDYSELQEKYTEVLGMLNDADEELRSVRRNKMHHRRGFPSVWLFYMSLILWVLDYYHWIWHFSFFFPCDKIFDILIIFWNRKVVLKMTFSSGLQALIRCTIHSRVNSKPQIVVLSTSSALLGWLTFNETIMVLFDDTGRFFVGFTPEVNERTP